MRMEKGTTTPRQGAPVRSYQPWEHLRWTHRQAVEIIGLLPDDHDEALAILDRARFFLENWSFPGRSRKP
jgi:hypothetical protein